MGAAARHQRPVPDLPAGQLHQLLGYHWPGNVRELRNVAERIVLGIAAGAAPLPGRRAMPVTQHSPRRWRPRWRPLSAP